VNRSNTLGAKQPGHARRNNECRIAASRQCRQIRVVVMIVADEYGVDAGQILPGYSRFSAAPRTGPGNRTRSLGPNRIRQDVGVPLLKEHGRVVHQSGSQSAAFHAAGRHGLFDVRNEPGRCFRPASTSIGEHHETRAPAQHPDCRSACRQSASEIPSRWYRSFADSHDSLQLPVEAGGQQ
jgi:hypothetical protein